MCQVNNYIDSALFNDSQSPSYFFMLPSLTLPDGLTWLPPNIEDWVRLTLTGFFSMFPSLTLEGLTWLPPWLWQGQRPTFLWRSSLLAGESMHCRLCAFRIYIRMKQNIIFLTLCYLHKNETKDDILEYGGKNYDPCISNKQEIV